MCVCPGLSGTVVTEVSGSGRPANQRCAAPYFLSRMASIPQESNWGCLSLNPSAETLIALYLHRLSATHIEFKHCWCLLASENTHANSHEDKMWCCESLCVLLALILHLSPEVNRYNIHRMKYRGRKVWLVSALIFNIWAAEFLSPAVQTVPLPASRGQTPRV